MAFVAMLAPTSLLSRAWSQSVGFFRSKDNSWFVFSKIRCFRSASLGHSCRIEQMSGRGRSSWRWCQRYCYNISAGIGHHSTGRRGWSPRHCSIWCCCTGWGLCSWCWGRQYCSNISAGVGRHSTGRGWSPRHCSICTVWPDSSRQLDNTDDNAVNFMWNLYFQS